MSVHRTDDGAMYHSTEECGPWCGQGYHWEALATYNAECGRGLVHTPEYDERMAKEQAAFDAHQKRRMQESGAVLTSTGGWLVPAEKKRRWWRR